MGTNEKQLDVITSILRVQAPGITVLVVNQDLSCHPASHVDHQAIFSYKGMGGGGVLIGRPLFWRSISPHGWGCVGAINGYHGRPPPSSLHLTIRLCSYSHATFHPVDQSQLTVVYHMCVYVFICQGLVRGEHLMNRLERDPFFHVHFRCNKFDMY